MNTQDRIAGYRRRFEAWFTRNYHNHLTRTGPEYTSLTTEIAWKGYQAGAEEYCHDATLYRALASTLIAQINGTAMSPLEHAISLTLHLENRHAGTGPSVTLKDLSDAIHSHIATFGEPA